MAKKECRVEDCEMPHCRRCGSHYEPCRETRNGVCDGCIIGQASMEAEAQSKAFGGNYEEAANFYGW